MAKTSALFTMAAALVACFVQSKSHCKSRLMASFCSVAQIALRASPLGKFHSLFYINIMKTATSAEKSDAARNKIREVVPYVERGLFGFSRAKPVKPSQAHTEHDPLSNKTAESSSLIESRAVAMRYVVRLSSVRILVWQAMHERNTISRLPNLGPKKATMPVH